MKQFLNKHVLFHRSDGSLQMGVIYSVEDKDNVHVKWEEKGKYFGKLLNLKDLKVVEIPKTPLFWSICRILSKSTGFFFFLFFFLVALSLFIWAVVNHYLEETKILRECLEDKSFFSFYNTCNYSPDIMKSISIILSYTIVWVGTTINIFLHSLFDGFKRYVFMFILLILIFSFGIFNQNRSFFLNYLIRIFSNYF